LLVHSHQSPPEAQIGACRDPIQRAWNSVCEACRIVGISIGDNDEGEG
jgi:hypothetical protein